LATPPKITGWNVERELGRGDFASVYLVHRGAEVAALKVCTNATEPAIERFRAEQEALAALDHPRVPRLLDADLVVEYPYIMMSLASGKPLKDSIQENHLRGRLFGDVETLELLDGVLDAIVHLHNIGLVHRDIKDANIMYDQAEENLTLIDFGFCKRAGQTEMRSSDSFWRVGAARFSPPSKLQNPAYADPSHDVFAVGVLAYRMLTGEFPWTVSQVDDVAALRELQVARSPEPVSELNSHVLPAVSLWVARLLDLDDRRRPLATDALKALEQLREVPTGTRRRHNVEYPHVIRDPIHKDIRITNYELELTNTAEMQRLRRIKQLGLTNMVYPGAEHSRLSHSIGCVARVEQIMRTIEERDGLRIDPEFRSISRIYALVHDVTHIPLGHTIEDEFGLFKRHDENQARIERLVLSDTSELGTALRNTESGRVVLEHIVTAEGDNERTAFGDLVSSVTGADVLDYIDRDAFFCGLEHRIDSGIFRQFRLRTLSNADDRRLESVIAGKYGLRIDRELAVETILKERYALFLKVYTHSAKSAASALLGKALFEAVRKSSSKRQLREQKVEWMGDETLIDYLASSSRSTVNWPAQRLARRRLPRGVYRGVLLEENERDDTSYRDKRAWLERSGLSTPEGGAEMERQLAKRAGADPQHVMVYCPPKAPGYRQVEHWVARALDEAPTRQRGSIGNEVARRHLGLWELWVFHAGDRDERVRSALADAAQDSFGLSNQVHIDRRQGRLF